MPNYVRVKDKTTGHHITVLEGEVEANPDAYQVLKQDAVNLNGDPLPPEFIESATPSSGQSASATQKEKS